MLQVKRVPLGNDYLVYLSLKISGKIIQNLYATVVSTEKEEQDWIQSMKHNILAFS